MKNAYRVLMNDQIAAHVKEGCGIRSIARLLRISANTVLRRIRMIADGIRKPPVPLGRIYEVDELKTYVSKKTIECWVTYALDSTTGEVVDLKVGKRNKKNIGKVINTLLLSDCHQIYTDGLVVYNSVIPKAIHVVRRYGTNKIERMNLNLRTHLKRLNRKTICYSKSLLILEVCLKIYCWYQPVDLNIGP